MGRSWSIYKDQEVKNFGSGFKGLNNSGDRPDGAIRYDFGDKKVSTYFATWTETGLGGMGWSLSIVDWVGDYKYSNSGELISLSHDRITSKTYTYYSPKKADREFAYSMVFEPEWNPSVNGGGHAHKKVTYYDSLYREDGDYQLTIDYWREEKPLVEIRDY